MTNRSRIICYALIRVCVPGIHSECQQQTKEFNFDDLCASKVVALAVSNCKDSQYFAIFHLIAPTSQVTVGHFFKPGILIETALKNSSL